MKKIGIFISIFFILGLVFTGCGNSKENNTSSNKNTASSIRVGFPGTGNNTASDLLAIAVDKGYFKDELKGVDVKVTNFTGAGPEINEALASKNLDIGVYGDTPSITAKANGIDTVLIGAGNTALDAAILVNPDSTIKSVKDLKGKKIAATKGSYMHRTLVEMLKANGISIDDVNFINMKSNDAESALFSKNVDAIVLDSIQVGKLVVNKQAKVLLDCKNYPEWKGMNLVVARSQFAKENPDIVVKFIKAYNKAKDFLDKNPDEAKAIWAKSGVSKAAFDYLYPGSKFGDTFNVEISKDTIQKLSYTEKFLLDNNLLKNNLDINTWVDNSYYEKSLK
ncbi:aliphatic sulfonate ABC transporter substrate-binding protein [Clostridium tyrobutyricum]|uniref:aliphatic sulfonate ABC transporter substrate-binding protein n=1 Tax=Clostridium tyrobutyricum TaxID=1519 RepID=UPI00057D8A44|nr:aliphatic sulfonate ABC transporter substrate-binding protein [Clostridium tyrobutyricum]